MKYFLAVVLVFVFVAVAFAEVPHLISFQGRLTTAEGDTVTGDHDLTFKLYNASGDELWSETHHDVPIVAGLYNVMLGSETPFPAAVDFSEQYYLGVTVDGGTEMTPRYQLGASPYALNLQSMGASDGQVLIWNATLSKWVPRDAPSLWSYHPTYITPSGNPNLRVYRADREYGIYLHVDDDDPSADSTRHGIYVYREDGELGTYRPGKGFRCNEALANIAAYDYDATKYNFAIAGWSFLDDDTSAAVFGSKYNGSVYGALGMQMDDHDYAGYFKGDVHITGDLTVDGSYPGGPSAGDNDWAAVGGGAPTLAGDIYHTGKVGIGTASPDEELVVGTPLGSGWAIPAITVGGATGGAVEAGNGTYTISMSSSSSIGRARIISSDDDGHGHGDIEFVCSAVGIGTSTPSKKLEVNGDAKVIEMTVRDIYSEGYDTGDMIWGNGYFGHNGVAIDSANWSGYYVGAAMGANGNGAFHVRKAYHNGLVIEEASDTGIVVRTGPGVGIYANATNSPTMGIIGTRYGAWVDYVGGDGNWFKKDSLTYAGVTGHGSAYIGVQGYSTTDHGGLFKTISSMYAGVVAVNASGSPNSEAGLFYTKYGSGDGDTIKTHISYRSGGGTSYGILSNGTKSTIMPTSEGQRILYCPESPEVWFEDYGRGQLVNGRAHITLDKLFRETVTIDSAHPMEVFLQPRGDCNGLYWVPANDGFDVIELAGGTSNAEFSYKVLAKRKGMEDIRFEKFEEQAPPPKPER